MDGLTVFFIIGVIFVVFTGGIASLHPMIASAATMNAEFYSNTPLPLRHASYKQWRYGHDCSSHNIPAQTYGDRNNLMYQYRPYHYGYGERAYGLFRPMSNPPAKTLYLQN